MTRQILLLSLACLLGIAAGGNRAAATSGQQLHDYCSTKDEKSAADLTCTAYVRGFVDGMIMGYTAHGTVRGYCPPVTGVSVEHGRAIIEKYMREHPKMLTKDAGIIAGLALAEAYPCKTRPQ